MGNFVTKTNSRRTVVDVVVKYARGNLRSKRHSIVAGQVDFGVSIMDRRCEPWETSCLKG